MNDITMRLNARELRTNDPDPEVIKNLKKNPIYIILDDVLDTYNVGAIFRLADATAVSEIILCGQTETPPNPKIKKASINTWRWVNWRHEPDASEVIRKYRKNIPGIKIVAVEQRENSVQLSKFIPAFPIVLVVGNESVGISRKLLDLSDAIVELPMYGINRSLNVMVSCGIVLYRILEYLPQFS